MNIKKSKLHFFSLIIIMMAYGCSLKWTEAIKRGEIAESSFNATLAFEETLGLIIVPVVINGKSYRFLFDTGAPLSISDEIWQENDFKLITTGNIVDSDKNRTKVNYVQIDTLLFGNTPFVNQTAFVANFELNPKIKCLDIDGIIGSNLMRHCNWEIDFIKGEIAFKDDSISKFIADSAVAVPFHTDIQYNILVDLKVGETVIRNLTIDYGSNGSLTLPEKVFQTLKQKGNIETTFDIFGTAKSGLLGEEIKIDREMTYADTIVLEDLVIDNVEIYSGKSGLVGTEILSRYHISIDWDRKQLLFRAIDTVEKSHKTFGFSLGYSDEKSIYVQLVIEASPAFRAGVEPGMEILKMDSLDFTNGNNFCDCMDYLNSESDTLSLKLKTPDGSVNNVFLEKSILIKSQ